MSDNSESTCRWMIQRRVYPDAETVAKALADDMIAAFDRAQKHTNPTALMLAGGRTPKAAYQLIAASGVILPLNMTLMISDERRVPLDHPDSNYLMMRPLLDAIKARPEQCLMVNTALPREEAAEDFGQRLDAFFSQGGVLSTAYLGLGADGHTASLFNEAQIKASEGRHAIDVDRPDGRIGISATPAIIQRAQRIVFVVTGADKKDMAHRLLHSPLSITAGNVVFRHPAIALWLDRTAAGEP